MYLLSKHHVTLHCDCEKAKYCLPVLADLQTRLSGLLSIDKDLTEPTKVLPISNYETLLLLAKVKQSSQLEMPIIVLLSAYGISYLIAIYL